jgi:hypothetical protein
MKPPLPPPSLDDAPSDQLTSQQVHEYRFMVKNMLREETEFTICLCGMVPLDIDDACYNIYHCDPSLEFDTHVEPEFYISRFQPGRMVLCCDCAGNAMPDSPVELNTQLKAPEGPYSVVLPICKSCIDSGCHISVRDARQNAAAKQANLEAKHARGVLRREETLVKKAQTNEVVGEEPQPSKPRAPFPPQHNTYYIIFLRIVKHVDVY